MFNPKYRLEIKVDAFPGDVAICLGNQVITVVNFLKTILPAHIWYGADIQSVGKWAPKLGANRFELKLIGSDQEFISNCSNVSQFLGGVFLSVDTPFLSPEITNIEIVTEDEPFRSIPIKGILLEMRMFDTSYIEIYSENKEVMKKIATNFRGSQLDLKS